LWCKRHHCLMPIVNRDVNLMASMQLEKQRIVLQKLLDLDDVNVLATEDVEQCNVLHYAVNYNSIEALSMLLEHPRLKDDRPLLKQLLEMRDYYDMTPLYRAVSEGRTDLAALLVKSGANYFAACAKTGERAIDLIFRNGGSNPSYFNLMTLIDELERKRVHGTEGMAPF